MRTRRFEVVVDPGLLDGHPPAFIGRVHECFAARRPARVRSDSMTYTARVQEGWIRGFQVEVYRVPGANELKVFVDPHCRLNDALLPVNLVAFIFTVLSIWLTPGVIAVPFGLRLSWLVALFAFLPIFALEWVLLRVVNRTSEAVIAGVEEQLFTALTSGKPTP
jgi:hypothetical protein